MASSGHIGDTAVAWVDVTTCSIDKTRNYSYHEQAYGSGRCGVEAANQRLLQYTHMYKKYQTRALIQYKYIILPV